MKRKRSTKRIPDDIREKVKIMAIEGHSERYIAKALSISNSEVHRIKKETDNLEQLRANKKRKMAESLWDLAIKAREQLTEQKLKDSSAARLVIVLATLIDKALLLTGEATGRIEVKTEKELTKELSELQAAEKELQEAWKRAMKKQEKAAEDEKS